MGWDARGIPEGTKIFIGKPAVPPDDSLLIMLKQIVDRTPGCVEAHLPQVFALGMMAAPRLALVVVVNDTQDPEPIAARLNQDIDRSVPTGTSPDVWVLKSIDHLLPAIRKAGSLL